MTGMTREQLARAGGAKQAAWLRDGLRIFGRTSDPGERARAFLPLVLRPRGHNPAGELSDEIEILMDGRVSPVATAVAKVLGQWSIRLDGLGGAVLGLNLATRLGAARVPQLAERLVREQSRLDPTTQDAEALMWAAIRGAAARGTTTQLMSIGSAISEAGLWTPLLVAEYGAVLGRSGLELLPTRLLRTVSCLNADPNSGQEIAELANRLKLEFRLDRLRSAFMTNDRDDAETAGLRFDLSEQLRMFDRAEAGAPVDPEAVEHLMDRMNLSNEAVTQAMKAFEDAQPPENPDVRH